MGDIADIGNKGTVIYSSLGVNSSKYMDKVKNLKSQKSKTCLAWKYTYFKFEVVIYKHIKKWLNR